MTLRQPCGHTIGIAFFRPNRTASRVADSGSFCALFLRPRAGSGQSRRRGWKALATRVDDSRLLRRNFLVILRFVNVLIRTRFTIPAARERNQDEGTILKVDAIRAGNLTRFNYESESVWVSLRFVLDLFLP